MNIYVLERKEGCPESSIGGYDQYDGFVICAQSYGQARELAWEHSGRNTVTGELRPDDAEDVWKEKDCTSVRILGTARTGQKAEVVLSDYQAG